MSAIIVNLGACKCHACHGTGKVFTKESVDRLADAIIKLHRDFLDEDEVTTPHEVNHEPERG